MKVLIAIVALGLAPLALAEDRRVAVHPLDARELTVEQREWLKAFFDVRLARTAGIRTAASSRIEDALATPKGRDCETKDSCLRYLAEATGSLYAVYARVRREPLGGELLVTARVVRADGAVVRKVSRRAQPQQNVELMDTCRTLVASAVDALELSRLPSQLPLNEPLQPSTLPPPPLLAVAQPAPSNGISGRRMVGMAMGSVGLATLGTGAVLFGMAAAGRSQLTPDRTGAVPSSQVARAGNVALQGQAGTVLIPLGVALGLGGALLALWPEARRVDVALTAGPGGGGIRVGGVLP